MQVEVDKRFAALVTEWEAEVKRQAEVREIARRQKCRAASKELRAQIHALKNPEAAAMTPEETIAAVADNKQGSRRRGSIFAVFGPKAHEPPAGVTGVTARETTKRGSIFAYTGRKDLQSGQQMASVLEVTCDVRNGLDPERSDRTQLVGFSKTIGLLFSDVNAVSRLVHSGTAASDGHLKIGDIVLEVDGQVRELAPCLPHPSPNSPPPPPHPLAIR